MSEALDDYEERIANLNEMKEKAAATADTLRTLIAQKNEVWFDGGIPFFYQKDKDVIQDAIDVLDLIQLI